MRITLSWTFFLLGDLVSRPMMRWDWAFLYPLYSTLMGCSIYLQGESDKGPWNKVADDIDTL